MSTTLILEFKSVLEILKHADADSYLRNYRSFPLSESDVRDLDRLVNNLRDDSTVALQMLDRCTLYSDNQKASAELIICYYQRLCVRQSEIPTFEEFIMFISALLGVLVSLVSGLEEVKEFKYKDFGDDTVKEALNVYIKMGKEIRKGTDFRNSPLADFEKITMDAESFFKIAKNKTKYKVNKDSVLKRTFIALAAPSFEGKTQSAFVFNQVRPLYFVENFALNTENHITQTIYKNYLSVSNALLEFSRLDYDVIMNDRNPYVTRRDSGLTEADLELIKVSGNYLEEYHRNTKFWVLGFLKELVKDATRNFDNLPDRPEWMDFHANRKDLLIKSASLEELKSEKLLFKGYCIFLDEFSGRPEIVLIRNFARLVGLRCIVANTNSNIANLTGIIQSRHGRTSGCIDVWAIVITHLNPVSRSVMQNVFKVRELSKSLLTRCAESDRQKMTIFTESLAPQQGKVTMIRPGLVGVMIEVINSFFEQKHGITILELIEAIVKKVGEKIISVKGTISTTINGVMANLCLFAVHGYDLSAKQPPLPPEIGPTIDKLYHRKSFLADHLYYLINPVCEKSFLFLAYASEDMNPSLRFYNKEGVREAWIHEYTYFRYDDILTSLACMSASSSKSILANLNRAIILGDIDAKSVPNLNNPVAISLDGNRLEVMTAFTIIEASHSFYLKDFSLSGQNGINFIRNILWNCIRDSDFTTRTGAILRFTRNEMKIGRFLENLMIPFLCPFNCAIPALLDKFKSDDCMDPSIHVGRYTRTPNSVMIDGHFDCYFKTARSSKRRKVSPPLPAFKALIECKNWDSPISSPRLLEILTRFLKIKGQKVSFIFCNSITSPAEPYPPLSRFCVSNKLIIYRIVKNDDSSFSFSPHQCDTPNPEITCFVFELDEINRTIS